MAWVQFASSTGSSSRYGVNFYSGTTLYYDNSYLTSSYTYLPIAAIASCWDDGMSSVCSGCRLRYFGWGWDTEVNHYYPGSGGENSGYISLGNYTAGSSVSYNSYVRDVGGGQTASSTASASLPVRRTCSFYRNYNSSDSTISASTSNWTGTNYPFPSNPTRTGYIFKGWFPYRSGGSAYSSIGVGSSDATVYAQWTAISGITVNFNANGGSVSPTTKTVTYDSAYGELPIPTKSKNSFNGWYTAASGGTLVTASTIVSNSGTHTLYAQWTQTSIAPPSLNVYYNNGVAALDMTNNEYDSSISSTIQWAYSTDNGANWTSLPNTTTYTTIHSSSNMNYLYKVTITSGSATAYATASPRQTIRLWLNSTNTPKTVHFKTSSAITLNNVKFRV